MRIAIILAAAATALAPVAPQAQEAAIRIDPGEAKQCAVWASMLSTQADEQTSMALLFALNYFVGQYEAATGKGIGELRDEALVVAVATGVAEFTEKCTTHMQDFGGRMVSWGEDLTALGQELQAQEQAQAQQ